MFSASFLVGNRQSFSYEYGYKLNRATLDSSRLVNDKKMSQKDNFGAKLDSSHVYLVPNKPDDIAR